MKIWTCTFILLFLEPGKVLAVTHTASEGLSKYKLLDQRKTTLISKETWALKPQVGSIRFTGVAGHSYREVHGAIVEYNILGRHLPYSNIYIGGSSGVLYGLIGQPSADYYGINPRSPEGDSEAYILQVPLNWKLGFHFLNRLRVSLHGGAMIFYRSVGNTVSAGSEARPDSIWDLFFNGGASAEFGLTQKLSFILRQDLISTAGNDIFTSTFGIAVGL